MVTPLAGIDDRWIRFWPRCSPSCVRFAYFCFVRKKKTDGQIAFAPPPTLSQQNQSFTKKKLPISSNNLTLVMSFKEIHFNMKKAKKKFIPSEKCVPQTPQKKKSHPEQKKSTSKSERQLNTPGRRSLKCPRDGDWRPFNSTA
uniref:(northern house mosquito) hypothetical protein n=1 Tax=Culex pipiens TaxID=7175 RepID=A0A8D8F379_CULPI